MVGPNGLVVQQARQEKYWSASLKSLEQKYFDQQQNYFWKSYKIRVDGHLERLIYLVSPITSRFVKVTFDLGDTQMVSIRYIIPYGGSTARPTLGVGDFLLVKSSHHNTSNDNADQHEAYVPGIMQVKVS